MMRYLPLLLILLPLAARAQTPARNANAPAANAPAANAPAATASGNAPAPGPGPAAAARRLRIRVPSGGPYTAYFQEAASITPRSILDTGELEIPESPDNLTLYVLDPRSGYAARKPIRGSALPAEVAFSSPDFRLIQKVRVLVTGKDDRPIAQGLVTLTDGGKNTSRRVIQPASNGIAEFDFVASGMGSVTVTPEGGSATTKQVSLDLPKGATVQEIPVALPEVTNTVAPATAPGAADQPAGNAPAANSAAPVSQPAQPLPPPPAGNWAGNLIAWVFLIALLAGGYLYLKQRGITAESLLAKLGVRPDMVAHDGGSLAGASLATASPRPGAPPPPPPIVADPNQCPYCGQMKDAAGGCACVVTPGARGGAIPERGSSFGTGPRLVGMAGTYMGQVFPIGSSATLGRDPTNSVPLDRDTTASRRHAQIIAEGGGYRIQDLGSSNGIYVNGARTTDAALNPGDEVSIGGTRFRFEV